MAAPGLWSRGCCRPPGQAPWGSIISARDKGAGVENPIVGPRMEISLIYSPRLPQAFCPRLFVCCSQLLPRGVSGRMAELEQDCSPIHWALPPRANPQLLQEERRGREGATKRPLRMGHLPQAQHSPHRKLSQSRPESAPNIAGRPEPCWGGLRGLGQGLAISA